MQPLAPMPADLAALNKSLSLLQTTYQFLSEVSVTGIARIKNLNEVLSFQEQLMQQTIYGMKSHPQFLVYFPQEQPLINANETKDVALTQPVSEKVQEAASEPTKKAGATKKIKPGVNDTPAGNVQAIKRTRGRPKKTVVQQQN